MIAQLENKELKAEMYCDQMMILEGEQMKSKEYHQAQKEGQQQMGYHSEGSEQAMNNLIKTMQEIQRNEEA